MKKTNHFSRLLQSWHYPVIFISVFMLYNVQLSFGQSVSAFTLTVTPTAETCPGNGALTIAVTGTQAGSTMTYSIKKPDNTTITTSQTYVSGLVAGSYTVTASQTLSGSTGTQQQTVTITNSVPPSPVFTASTTTSGCSGTITLTVSQGTVNSYTLSQGSTTIKTQASNVFTNVAGGNYHIVGTDGCGRAYGIDVNVPAPAIAIEMGDLWDKLSGCSQITWRNTFTSTSYLAYPLSLTYTISNPSGGSPTVITQTITSGSATSQQYDQIIPFYDGQAYNISLQVTDACSNTTTVNKAVNLSSFLKGSSSDGKCGARFLSIQEFYMMYPYTFTILQQPAGSNITTTPTDDGSHNLFSFGSVSSPNVAGIYKIQVTDACGTSHIVEYEHTNVANRPLGVNYYATCDDNLVTFDLWDPNGNFTNIAQITGPNGVVPASQINIMPRGNRTLIQDVVAGNYTVTYSDECVTNATQNIAVPDVADPAYTFNVVRQCSSFYTELTFFNEPKYWNLSYRLEQQNATTGVWSLVTDQDANGILSGTSASFFKTGKFRLSRYFYTVVPPPAGDPRTDFVSSWCKQPLQEFEVGSTAFKITNAYAFWCNENLADVVITVDGGVGTVNYSIAKKNGTAFTVTNNTSNIFLGLTPGIYEFHAVDGCSNEAVFTVDLNTLDLPKIKPVNLCDGQAGKLSVDGVPYLNFSWTKDGNATVLSTTSSLSFASFNSATDAGTYRVRLTSGVPNNCVDKTLTFIVTGNTSNPNAGTGKTINLCTSSPDVNLNSYLSTGADTYGDWTETTSSGKLVGSFWSPSKAGAGTYQFTYTVKGLCSGVASSNFTIVTTAPPATPTVTTTAATCSAAGTATVSNYNSAYIYTFSPTGPSVGAGGAISGMTAGTSYTVTALVTAGETNVCESAASASFKIDASSCPFTCDNYAYLFQSPDGIHTEIIRIDIATDEYTTLYSGLTLSGDRIINAVGFNVKDNYLWGKTYHTDYNLSSTSLVRIDKNGNFTEYPIANLPLTYYIDGTIDDNGVLYLYSGGNTFAPNPEQVERIDLDPASPTYLTRLSPLTLTNRNSQTSSDFVFNPIDGYIYFLSNEQGVNPRKLFRLNRTTGDITLAATVTSADADFYNSLLGGVYLDANGNFYGSGNSTGKIFKINAVQSLTGGNATAWVRAQGAQTSYNDGAMCFNACIKPDAGADQIICTGQTATMAATQASGIEWQTVTGNPATTTITNTASATTTITGFTAPGSYYFIWSNGGVCNDTVKVTVNNTPSTPTVTTTVATCSAAGTATISNYNSAYTYTFSPTGPSAGSGGAITGMTPGTSYTVTATSGTCTSAASASFRVLASSCPFICSNYAYLWQSTDGINMSLIRIDISTNQFTTLNTGLTLPNNHLFNAIGYNVKDNYFWGKTPKGTPTNPIVRFDANGTFTEFTVAGIPVPSTDYNSGTIDENGILYFTEGNNFSSIERVDLDPASPTYLTRLSPLSVTPPVTTSFADFGFNPIDNSIYYVNKELTGSRKMYKISRSNGAITQVANLTSGDADFINSAFGGVYIDANGSFYGSDNNTGKLYKINEVQNLAGGTATALLVASGSPTYYNDGAMCINACVKPNAGTDQSICVGQTATMAANNLGISWEIVAGNPATTTITNTSSATTTITGFTAPGNYYFVWSNGGSCNDTVKVTVNSTPSTPTVTTTAATCSAAGTATISNYNSAYTYTFSPTGPSVGAGGAITGMTSGVNYTVTAASGSCVSAASTSFSIVGSKLPLPNPGIIQRN